MIGTCSVRRSIAGRFGRRKASQSSCYNLTQAVCRAKSFADDLVTERGIVNGRVALCYDPLRLSLRSSDLFHWVSKGRFHRGWCLIQEVVGFIDAHPIHGKCSWLWRHVCCGGVRVPSFALCMCFNAVASCLQDRLIVKKGKGFCHVLTCLYIHLLACSLV